LASIYNFHTVKLHKGLDGKGIARALMVSGEDILDIYDAGNESNIPYALNPDDVIVFNAYGLPLAIIAKILSTFWDMPSRSVRLEHEYVCINNGEAYLYTTNKAMQGATPVDLTLLLDGTYEDAVSFGVDEEDWR
jgi:hypothetical protein